MLAQICRTEHLTTRRSSLVGIELHLAFESGCERWPRTLRNRLTAMLALCAQNRVRTEAQTHFLRFLDRSPILRRSCALIAVVRLTRRLD